MCFRAISNNNTIFCIISVVKYIGYLYLCNKFDITAIYEGKIIDSDVSGFDTCRTPSRRCCCSASIDKKSLP